MPSKKTSVAGIARSAKAADAKLRKAVKTNDSFQNYTANIGINTNNLSSGGTYGFNPITRNRTLCEWIHRGSWLGGIAVDLIAQDMTRAGVSIESDLAPEQVKKIEDAIVQMDIWGKVEDTIKWSRLYGGAIGVLLIEGQDMSTELRENTIATGQFKGIYVLDRWMVDVSIDNLVKDFGPELGTPMFYTVLSNAPGLRGMRIHHSRVIRLLGTKLPYQQSLTENLWGLSVYERFYDRMLAFDSATQGTAQMVYKAYLRTYKIKGLRDIIASGGQAALNLQKFVSMMSTYQSIEGITLIDLEDEFEGVSNNTFSGLSDVIVQMGEQVSGALQIPGVRMFGQSPTGMNSTGESDLKMYYDNINKEQNTELYVDINLVYRCVARSEGVKINENFGVKFRPLWQLSEAEKSEIANRDTQTFAGVEATGAVPTYVMLQELKKSALVTGRWSTIPDEYIVEMQKENESNPAPAQGERLDMSAETETGADSPPPKGKKSKTAEPEEGNE